MQIGSSSKRQELGCGTESRSIPAQSKPTTCISDSAIACSKNYKAKGSICVSIFDQWLLSGCSGVAQGLLYRYDHVDMSSFTVRKKH